MKKFESVIIMFFLLFLCFEMISDSRVILNSTKLSLEVFKNSVFPSLFPFFVLSNLLLKYGFAELFSNIFKGPMSKIFKVSGKCAFVFFISIISGNPSNAKYTRKLYLNGDINIYELLKVLCFSSFVSPLFVMGFVGSLLNSERAAFLILFCHYLGNIITGILIRNYHPCGYEKSSLKKAIYEMHRKRISNKESFGVIITNSLIDSINTLLLILGTITICFVFTSITNNSFNGIFRCFLSGVTEMTQGIKYISMENISLKFKAAATVFFLSFGGLSIHLQIMGILNDINFKYFPFLCMRLLSSFISSIIFLILYG